MKTTELLVVLLAWYVPGFATAAFMTRRGHDSLAWVYAAWVGGALCVPAAVGWILLIEPRLVAARSSDHVVDLTDQPRRPSFELEARPYVRSGARPGPTTKRRIR